MVAKHRVRDGQTKTTSFCILDAQSVKNSATSRTKGYDAAEKISGIKRPIAVDTVGLPHGYLVTPANISDKAGAIERLKQPDFPRVKSLLCDGGYLGKSFQEKGLTAIGATVQVVKRSELHTFKVLPQRWVVERSFAWLETFRRRWKSVNALVKAVRK